LKQALNHNRHYKKQTIKVLATWLFLYFIKGIQTSEPRL
jgi:hypothetical protein